MTPAQRRHVLLNPLKLWGVLLALVAATAAYAFWPGAPFKTGVALAIGAIKAALIAIVFMQLRRATPLVRLAAIAGLAWLSFLYLLTFADLMTRS